MLNPRVLLLVVLWSLGAAAVLGAVGVLTGGEVVLYRMVGTLSLTAICAGLLFWVTRKLSDPAVYAAAMLATVLVVIEFLLGLFAIWAVDHFLFTKQGEYCWELIFSIAAAGGPAVVCMRYLHHPEAGVASVVGLLLCGIVFAIWLIGMSSDSWVWWESDYYIYGFGFLAVLALVGVGKDRRHWRWGGIVCCVAAAVIGIKFIDSSETWPIDPMTVVIGLAVLVAHANLALRCPLRPGQRWIAYITVGAVALAAIFCDVSVFSHQEMLNAGPLNVDSLPNRLAAACGIIAACGSLALIILWRSNQKLVLGKRAAAEALDVGALQVTVICPTCQNKQVLGKAGAACSGCGLRMKIVLEEPRCESCGYSLLMISSDRCPECGASTAPHPVPAV
jgi:hypothetical protein